MAETSALKEVAGKLAHLEQEAEIAALRGDSCARTLEDFDNTLRALVVEYRREHEEEIGWVGGGIFVVIGGVASTRMRSDERAVLTDQNLMQQAAMLLLTDLILDEAGLLQIDLIGQLQAAAFGNRPNGAARRRECGHDLVQHCVVEVGGRNFAPRQLGDFVDKSLDLALSAFYLIGIHRRGAA